MLGPVHPRYIPVPFQDSAESGRLILRDGSTAQVRVATDRDSAALADFFRCLSPESRRHRFLSASPPAPDLVSTLCQGSDGHSTLTLVATRRLEGAPQIIATGSYLATGEKVAEVALAVDDAFRGKGLGTLLLERLALLAAGRGFTRFWAVADPDNRPVLEVFRASGFYVKERAGRDQVEVDLSVIPTGVTVERLETRDRVATIASLRPFFRPNAVAVVGASRNPAAIGHRVLQGLLRDRFSGPVYAVNPRATEVIGVQTYPSVRELPGPTDLAILAVPRAAITGVVDDCAAHGVRALVDLTADFAEAGPAGAAARKALREQVRGYGMRMVGPNCLGLINADPAVRLNASFSPVFPPAGRVAMSSQSGAVGLAALSVAGRYGMGISTFVSVGNKADVSGNDLLQYWEEDAAKDVILLYLESLGNPRRFARIARRVGRRKPVVVLHSGLTKAGARAAGSHTAALAASVIAADALFCQCGVIRAESLEELLDLAMVLGGQPLPRGRRVGIVTNAGGPGILCADACEAGGLEVPDPSPGLRARIAELVPGAASLGNPTDLLASAGAEAFRLAVEAVLASGEVDALIVIYAPVGLAETGAVCEGISRGVAGDRAAGGSALPVLTCVLGQESHRTHLEGTGERIPCYSFPETPARALGKVAAYAAWQAKPAGEFPDLPEMTLEVARAVCRKALADRGPGWLSADEVRGILAAAGLPLVPGTVARTPDEAAERAAEIGFRWR
jgi:acetate---CoA ligase (ADP-forming)